MDDRDHIIRLGKCLAAEAKAGYLDAAAGGLETFLLGWRGAANGAASHPVVEEVLERLASYHDLPPDERRDRIDRSLVDLRALFRAAPTDAAPTSQPASVTPPVRPVPVRRPITPLQLTDALSTVPGIGVTTARSFARLGLRTVEDMLYHFPHRYDDYSDRQTIVELVVNQTATIVGE